MSLEMLPEANLCLTLSLSLFLPLLLPPLPPSPPPPPLPPLFPLLLPCSPSPYSFPSSFPSSPSSSSSSPSPFSSLSSSPFSPLLLPPLLLFPLLPLLSSQISFVSAQVETLHHISFKLGVGDQTLRFSPKEQYKDELSLRNLSLPTISLNGEVKSGRHNKLPKVSLELVVKQVNIDLTTDVLNQLLILQNTFIKVLQFLCKLLCSSSLDFLPPTSAGAERSCPAFHQYWRVYSPQGAPRQHSARDHTGVRNRTHLLS